MLHFPSSVSDVFDPDPTKQAFHDIAHAFLNSPIYTFANFPRIKGVGLYSLHYLGDPLRYAPDYDYAGLPIYVGKTVPKGWTIGMVTNVSQSDILYNRMMKDHYESIDQVNNLNVADFMVRVCLLHPVWIESAETFLVHQLQPLWNTQVRGFGNKVLGNGRKDSAVSLWDLYHPGRARVRKGSCSDQPYGDFNILDLVKV